MGKISGKVVDSATKNQMEYASIILFEKAKKNPINGMVTGPNGNFILGDLKMDDEDRIQVNLTGYSQKIISGILLNADNLVKNLGSILLFLKSKTLKGVVITSQKDLIESRIDKIVYNAENDLNSQGGVATHVLKKIPQVSVDIDGNVELAGSSGIQFLINGKPSAAFGPSIADV